MRTAQVKALLGSLVLGGAAIVASAPTASAAESPKMVYLIIDSVTFPRLHEDDSAGCYIPPDNNPPDCSTRSDLYGQFQITRGNFAGAMEVSSLGMLGRDDDPTGMFNTPVASIKQGQSYDLKHWCAGAYEEGTHYCETDDRHAVSSGHVFNPAEKEKMWVTVDLNDADPDFWGTGLWNDNICYGQASFTMDSATLAAAGTGDGIHRTFASGFNGEGQCTVKYRISTWPG
ncbi:hypothetical protein ACGFT2_06445 [Streptomyces sp. NPDC048514]|uniref:hypothetical protein n=1 Tax=Streptomyces sp. NPDC048514 TaxID=3365564 RepID=UPI003712B8C8